jgi:hypothetical protein
MNDCLQHFFQEKMGDSLQFNVSKKKKEVSVPIIMNDSVQHFFPKKKIKK